MTEAEVPDTAVDVMLASTTGELAYTPVPLRRYEETKGEAIGFAIALAMKAVMVLPDDG